jgi:DnaJ-class molecular chaperone
MFWGVDLYRVLRVSSEAGIDEVHAAYAAARRNRPATGLGRMLALLQGRSVAAQDHAYRVLSDTELRKSYDQQLERSLWLMQFPPGH